MDLTELPGGERIRRGLADLEAGRESVDADLVRLGAPRLARLGLAVPTAVPDDTPPDTRLFRKLLDGDPARAHARYNALVRELIQFERAARWQSSR